jgi:hypothetical protein
VSEKHAAPDGPRLTVDMLREGIAQVLREPPRGWRATFHHPHCQALKTGSLEACNCMGWMYPT